MCLFEGGRLASCSEENEERGDDLHLFHTLISNLLFSGSTPSQIFLILSFPLLSIPQKKCVPLYNVRGWMHDAGKGSMSDYRHAA